MIYGGISLCVLGLLWILFRNTLFIRMDDIHFVLETETTEEQQEDETGI